VFVSGRTLIFSVSLSWSLLRSSSNPSARLISDLSLSSSDHSLRKDTGGQSRGRGRGFFCIPESNVPSNSCTKQPSVISEAD
jgi:hypothetical protein